MTRSPYTLLLLLFTACGNPKTPTTPQPSTPATSNWCDKTIRPELKNLTKIPTSQTWFSVYLVGDSTYALAERYNFQEVISYLTIGEKTALLFDTGMGMDSISPVVKKLTSLPVIVLNSHTHYDHIGGNYEFSNILAMNTGYTRAHAGSGYRHSLVAQEVTPDAFCREQLPGLDTANYHIRPFPVSKFITDGYTIDLGGRTLTVIATPGHTPDAVSLWDEKKGYLFTGDTYYNGPIFLFVPETDLDAYQQSIGKLAALAPRLKKIFPAHNIPGADPRELIDASQLFQHIKDNKAKGESGGANILSFKADKFSFLIDSTLLHAQPHT